MVVVMFPAYWTWPRNENKGDVDGGYDDDEIRSEIIWRGNILHSLLLLYGVWSIMFTVEKFMCSLMKVCCETYHATTRYILYIFSVKQAYTSRNFFPKKEQQLE